MKKQNLFLATILIMSMSCEDENNPGASINLWGVDYPVQTTLTLELYNLNTTGAIPAEIGQLTKLRHLDLGKNQFSGSIPPEIGNLTELSFLSLKDNQLTGEIPEVIGTLQKLNYLYLSGNQFTGEIPSAFGNLDKLY